MDAQHGFADWRTSSYSGANGECVEVAGAVSHIAVRDSKNPEGGALTMANTGWADLLDEVRAGRLDLA
ncbi:DUF397 domain-containing protein [Actinomadura flavalba]|uniref:DUF397 domain-containing protein n=1 Tax=Actinomadura flavalba TaxID=1120938 RepID=UPI0003603FC5|nr:DUF397 domain-containing protein [Actinomadura flavalba]